MRHDTPHPLLLALVPFAFAAGCAATPPQAAAPAFEAQSEPAEPENTWTPQSPQEKWWEAQPPCPAGAALVGDVPPRGRVLECKTPDGKRNGMSSVWFENGHSGTLTEYENDVPNGRWLYWLHGQKLVEGRFDHGRRHGQWTFWFDPGTGLDMRSLLQTQNPKQYVVETYDHGLLVKTTHYEDGKVVP